MDESIIDAYDSPTSSCPRKSLDVQRSNILLNNYKADQNFNTSAQSWCSRFDFDVTSNVSFNKLFDINECESPGSPTDNVEIAALKATYDKKMNLKSRKILFADQTMCDQSSNPKRKCSSKVRTSKCPKIQSSTTEELKQTFTDIDGLLHHSGSSSSSKTNIIIENSSSSSNIENKQVITLSPDIFNLSKEDQWQDNNNVIDEILTQPNPCVDNDDKIGSDWLKNLKTPTKITASSTDFTDSAKKSRFIKGGLAERLQKLNKNLCSTINIWNHKQINSKLDDVTSDQVSNSLQLKVMYMEQQQYGIFLLHCNTLSADRGTDVFICMYTQQIKEKDIHVGSKVKLFHPWQKLKWKNGIDLILCANFIVTDNHIDFMEKTLPYDEPFEKLVYEWACPCLMDDITPCSGNCYDGTKICLHSTLSSINSSVVSECSSCRLTLISDQSNCCKVTQVNNILKAVEDAGGCLAQGVSFRAAVLKVFRYSENGSAFISFLVKDKTGTMAKLQTKIEKLEGVELVPGNTYLFNDLTVVHRDTSSKNPALFSILRNFSRLYNCKRPTFCYILSFLGQVHALPVEDGSIEIKEVQYHSLRYMQKTLPLDIKHFNINVRLCYIYFNYCYITDNSVNGSITKVKLLSSSFMPEILRDNIPLPEKQVVCIENISVLDGACVIDEYSKVYLLNSSKQIMINRNIYNSLRLVNLSIAPVSIESSLMDMVIVQGSYDVISVINKYQIQEKNSVSMCSSTSKIFHLKHG